MIQYIQIKNIKNKKNIENQSFNTFDIQKKRHLMPFQWGFESIAESFSRWQLSLELIVVSGRLFDCAQQTDSTANYNLQCNAMLTIVTNALKGNNAIISRPTHSYWELLTLTFFLPSFQRVQLGHQIRLSNVADGQASHQNPAN